MRDRPAREVMVAMDGTAARLYYNKSLVGAQQTISDAGLQTGQAHGLYSTDILATLDGFVVWARGTGGEYGSVLNNYINP